MYRAIGFDKRNENYPQLTDHYFTGDYPVKPIDELGDSKITQLSLLSTASNNWWKQWILPIQENHIL